MTEPVLTPLHEIQNPHHALRPLYSEYHARHLYKILSYLTYSDTLSDIHVAYHPVSFHLVRIS